jgi:hypothetical protein
MFFHPNFFVPLVNQEQLYGRNDLNTRGLHWLFEVIGHLKPGVSRAQAIADLNAIGADLERNYPKDDGQMTFALAHPSFYGDYFGPAIQAFLAGLMLLATLILLAACANLGSLFAARAADRSREVALRLAGGSGPHARSQAMNPGRFGARMAAMSLGRNGGHAINHRDLWNGCLLGEQTNERVGNPDRTWCAAQGSAAGGTGTSGQASDFRFNSRIVAGNARQQGTRCNRVSGDATRSAGTSRNCCSYVTTRTAGYVDPGTACAVT